MMKNIAIGKIGSKLIFNRDSEEGKRSGANGNNSAYGFYKTLLKNFNDINFLYIGDNDYNIDDSNKKADLGIFLLGIYKEDDKVIKYINENKNLIYIFIIEDPRIAKLYENVILENYPITVMSQVNGWTKIGNKFFYNIFCNQEVFMYDIENIFFNYNSSFDYKNKSAVNVLCNTNGKDRLKNIIEYHKYFTEKGIDFNIYGRIDESITEYKEYFKGEIKIDEAQNKLRYSLATICLPVDDNWCTTKYIESANNYCIPLMPKNYGPISLMDNFIIDSPKDAYEKFIRYSKDKEFFIKDIKFIHSVLSINYKKYIKFIGGIINELV